MTVLLCIALIAADSPTRAQQANRVIAELTAKDWGSKIANGKGEVTHYRRLALQPGRVPEYGTAWYLEVDAGDRTIVSACRGRYAFSYGLIEQGNLRLELNFTRRYLGRLRVNEKVDWRVDLSYGQRPTGVMVEVPLLDSDAGQDVPLVISESHWIDGQGNTLRRVKDGLVDALKGISDEKVSSTGHLPAGEVVMLKGIVIWLDYLE